MKHKIQNYRLKFLPLILFMALAASVSLASDQCGLGEDCGGCNTAIACGRATSDGSVLLAKVCTRNNEECAKNAYYPRQTHPKGSKVKCTWIEIPQAEETYANMGHQPFFMWGYEHGMNEFGVAAANEAVWYRDGTPEGNTTELNGNDLVRIGLERGKTAREAVQVIIDTYQKHGQYGCTSHINPKSTYSNAIAVVDPNEAWVVELPKSGYIAYRIPDDGIFSMNNVTNIETQYDIISPNLIDLAIQKGWHITGDQFNFAFSYLRPEVERLGAELKKRRVQGLLEEKYGKIDVQWMIRILRDRREEDWTQERFYPLHTFYIIDQQTETSSTGGGMVAHLRKNMPNPIGSVYWMGLSSSNVCPFTQFYFAGKVPEQYYKDAQPSYFPESPWWTYDVLDRMSRKNYNIFANVIRNVVFDIEKENFLQASMLEKEALKLLKEGKKAEVDKLLTDFYQKELDHQMKAAKATANALVELNKALPGKIISFYDYDGSNIRAELVDLFERKY